MKGRWIHFVAAYAAFAAWGATGQADAPPPTLWRQQIESGRMDTASGIAADGGGNVYVAGHTNGDLGGPNQGSNDAFIVACDSAGTLVWARQIGTSEWDDATGIAVYGTGNSYITGYTYGDLGGPNQGEADAFLAAFDSGGTAQWTRQFGTANSDQAQGIALDGSGNAYIAGYTGGDLGGPNQGDHDAFIVKYDSSGTVQWARQTGTSERDRARAIAIDGSGNSYITGGTEGDLGGPNQGGEDVFVVKYDSSGTVQWTRQMGTSARDEGHGIAVDGSGNSYIAGSTYGDLGGAPQYGEDAFLAKLDSSGAVQWIREGGGYGGNMPFSYKDVAVDSDGNPYVTGREWPRSLLAKYGGDGTEEWKREVCYLPEDVALDAGGNIYVTGHGSGWWVEVVKVASYPATAGDATLDGCVDGLDYIAWSNNYELSDRWWEEGDFTGEGYVDGLDYVLWSSNYKVACPGVPGAVPEPSCALVLILGICALRRRRHGA